MEAQVSDTTHTPLSQDAALVLALAGTAIPFAHSAQDEAERWLRVLRLHGQVGVALQALGVGEAPLMTCSSPADCPAGSKALGPKVLEEVTRRSMDFAAIRGAERTGTGDLLFAVLEVYGQMFDRALYLRGTSRDELIERLAGKERRAEATAEQAD
jgi:hypothetical protein